MDLGPSPPNTLALSAPTTKSSEFKAVWRVNGWRENFPVFQNIARFTFHLPNSSLRFFFRRNPQTTMNHGRYKPVSCTEWLSLCVTLETVSLPQAFLISVDKLDWNDQVTFTLLSEQQIIMSPMRSQVLIPYFFPLRTTRCHSHWRRLLPQVPPEEELRLLLIVAPFGGGEGEKIGFGSPGEIIGDNWDLFFPDDKSMDVTLESSDQPQEHTSLLEDYKSSSIPDATTEKSIPSNSEAPPPPKKPKEAPPPRKRKKKKGGGRPLRSLFCLGPNNLLRKLCYAITDSKPFEYLILGTILATCVTLAKSTPYPNGDSDYINEVIEESEIVFTVIFTAECFMRIIAQGLILHEGAYLRDSVWNVLDFIIVAVGLLSSILSSVMEGFDLKALRAFRVLRPLKLVSNVPALQVVMNSILMAMIPLFNISVLVFFVMGLYAIIGLQMFQGKLHNSCFHNQSREIMDEPCNCGGLYTCEDMDDGDGGSYECRPYWDGPNDGITNFDNIGLAMLTVYQCISLEGWSDVMYNLQDAMGEHWEWIYFVSMVFFGALFTMNLILGVLSGEFGKQKDKVESRFEAQRQREEKMLEANFNSYLNWITNAKHTPNPWTEGEEKPPRPWKQLKDKSSGCWRTLKPTRQTCRALIKSQFWFWLVILLVFLNTMVLATEHHNQPGWLEEFQESCNIFFVVLFILEMLLKMFSLGFPRYFRSLFNRFEFIATIMSVVELVLVRSWKWSPAGISVLRCVRLLRCFKITRYWKAMCSLVASLLASLKSIASLLVLLYLFIMIFALLGMQLFGGKFNIDPNDYPPRSNFDSFSHASLTVFQVLTGEDWNEVMYSGIAAEGGVASSGMIIAAVYFLILFTFGNYILLNVFLAIAVDGLELESDVEKEEEPEGAPAEGEGEISKEKGDESETPPPPKAEPEPEPEEEDPICPPIPEGSSFFILGQENCLRVFLYNILSNKIVATFLLICILVSSACLAAEDPVYEDSSVNQILGQVDYFFTSVFTIELVLKILVYGVIFHQGAFMRSAANLLDLLVVAVSLVSIFSTSGAADSVRVLRVARVLRPLRAVNRAKGLKRVIQAMIVAIQTIGNIVIVTTLLIFIYAVIGVQLFKGALYQCTDASKRIPQDCRGNFLNIVEGKPILEEREWENSPFNFDSVPKGMLTLFAVSTFEGWPQMLYKTIDAAGEDMAPIYNNRLIVAFYYISFLVIVSFYMINIFVGFVILTFQEEGEAEFQHLEMDKNQRDCIAFALKAKPIPKYTPTNNFQARFWALVSSQTFDTISLSLVILNTFTMAAGFYNQPQWYTETMGQINIFFTIAFTIEFLLKLVALGVRNYFRDGWNTLDFVIVLGSYVDVVLPNVNASFLRLFRAGRLIKLLNKSEGLRTILFTFIKSINALPYVILLILLVFFIYGVVGMQSFGKIRLDSSTQIHRNNNFQNFGNAMLLLFRCATGEAWQEVMMSCVAQDHVKCELGGDEGDDEDEPSCGSTMAYPYFISFFVVCAFLVLNLLVAVIMDNFDYLTRDTSILGEHHLNAFVQKWSEFDPDATGRARLSDVVKLLKGIDPPLGFGFMCPEWIVRKKLVALNMPMSEDGKVGFNATLLAIVRYSLQIRMEGNPEETNDDLRNIIQNLWGEPKGAKLEEVVPTLEVLQGNTAGKFCAIITLQRRFRMVLLRRRKRAGERVGDKKNSVYSLESGSRLLDEMEYV